MGLGGSSWRVRVRLVIGRSSVRSDLGLHFRSSSAIKQDEQIRLDQAVATSGSELTSVHLRTGPRGVKHLRGPVRFAR
jgi:hypothetical protein